MLEPLKLERIFITISGLSPDLSGTKIVQLSDLHYDGIRLSEKLLSQAIELCNREYPDLIVITGDFITDNPRPIEALALRLAKLQSKLGIYGCLGNHDIVNSPIRQKIIDALAAVDIKILWNEVAYPLGSQLAIAGLPDFWSREFNPELTLGQIAPDVPRIVLSHNPDSAAVLKNWRVDLQLSGHTHGGQVVIPGYGPAPQLLQQIRPYIPQRIGQSIPYIRKCFRILQNWQWSQGWHQINRNQLYVNRGLGTYAPGRFCCPPEVTVITLD
jgi:uncharacterized protein